MSLAPTRLGATGPTVFPLGLGCMALSGVYGPTDHASGLAVIRRALDRGVTLFDTGDLYGMGHNELLVGEAIRGRRDRVQLSVKFGALRDPGGNWLGVDNRPAAVKTFAAYTLRRLGVEVIDVYRPARLDPAVPIEDTVGAVAELVQKGYVRHLGLSEVGEDTIRRAVAVHPVVDLQIEYAIVSRGPEARLFPVLRELGLSATLYGVLSRGLVTGSTVATPGDFRAHLPRFSATHRAGNDAVLARFRAFAADRGHTPASLAYAWVLAKQPGFVPLLGARTVDQLDDSLAAVDRPLTAADVAALEALVPADAIAGTRYAAPQMAHLDSER
ncbi:MAG: aldo/keto reductase [Myxococcota bacterium]